MHLCPICETSGALFFKDLFFECPKCKLLFRPKEHLLSGEQEKNRYEEHNNNSSDLGYQQFVMPVVEAVTRNFTRSHRGLDFGCGKDSAVVKLLQERGYSIELYDPFFYDDPSLLQKKYDYIIACEVIEHLYTPLREFTQLKNMLSHNGKLFCMTHIYDRSIDFPNWYYKNDKTHVCIYQKETLEYIFGKMGFASISIDGRLISFST